MLHANSFSDLKSIVGDLASSELVLITDAYAVVAEDAVRTEQCARALLAEAGTECKAVFAAQKTDVTVSQLPWDRAILRDSMPYANPSCLVGYASNVGELLGAMSGIHSLAVAAVRFTRPEWIRLDSRSLLFATMLDSNDAWAFNGRAVVKHSNLQSCVLHFGGRDKCILPYVPYELRPAALKLHSIQPESRFQTTLARIGSFLPDLASHEMLRKPEARGALVLLLLALAISLSFRGK